MCSESSQIHLASLSKYVAERIVYQAIDRGLPTTIYRLGKSSKAHLKPIGMVGFSLTTGAGNMQDKYSRLIGGMRQLQCAPEL